ncbi:MAG: VOC family protein [Quadrisphaera sp.]
MSVRRVVPVLVVEDLAAARAVYEDVLGLSVVMDHGWIVTLADPADPGGPQLSLMTGDATASVDPEVSVEVDDLDAAHLAALGAGVEVVHGPVEEAWGVRRFFFRDPVGRVVNVLSHRRAPDA